MASTAKALSKDIVALKAALLTATTRALQVEAELANAKARASDDKAMIAHQQLQIAKLRHQLYGQRSERSVRLLEQLTLAFEELESAATADEMAAEQAAARTTNVAPFTRKRPARQPFPEHLPRERVVEPAPTTCLCCGSARLRKLGEDITETLEVIPRSWKSHPARAEEVLLPGVREGEPGAGAIPCDAAWLGRSQPAGPNLLAPTCWP